MKKLQKITGVLLSAAMAAASMPGTVVSAAGEGSGVRITEICTQNKTSLLDSSGSPADWIELYNDSGSAADIGGWTLSDTSKSWTFPENVRIGAGEYLIVFADKASSTESELHTGFGLSKSGDTLRLADASGAVVQDITIPGLGEDRTYGLLPGTEEWAEMAASPGRENDASVAEPRFSLTSGFYDAAQRNTLELSASGEIYYTTDGSDPTASDSAKLYSGALELSDRSSDPNIWSNYDHKDNSPYSITLKTQYNAPSYPVEKASVIRAAAKSGGAWSKVVTNTYFVLDSQRLEHYRDIPVVSLVTDGENLFNKDTGIYVCGQQYLDWKNSSDYKPNKSEWDTDNVANFFSKGKEWERPATISLFQDGQLTMMQDMGIRIKGASTRNAQMKSFNVYARSEYGDSKLNFDLIPDNRSYDDNKQIKKFNSFSLRACSWINRYRDHLVQEPLKDVADMATIDREKAVLFINGEYWGLYEIQEKISDSFIQSNYGIDDKDVAMIKDNALEEGTETDKAEFDEMIAFATEMDMTNAEYYSSVTDKLDTGSMIDHFCTCLYTGMWDWPNHNYIAWRSNGAPIQGNPYSDGKWRFGTYDFDYTCGLDYDHGQSSFSYDHFQKLDGNTKYVAAAFLNLMKNEQFKEEFMTRFCDYANVVFAPDKMEAEINRITDKYLSYFVESQLRWNAASQPNDQLYNSEQNYLSGEIGNVRNFFRRRPDYAVQFMMNFCGSNKAMHKLTLNTSGEGTIMVNGVPVKDQQGSLVCTYPEGSEITVSAVPGEGKGFDGWSGSYSGSETAYTFTLDGDMELTANFGDYVPTGDVNADGNSNMTDAVLLQKWLLAVPGTKLADWRAGDLCWDERLDVYDMILMKELVAQSNSN